MNGILLPLIFIMTMAFAITVMCIYLIRNALQPKAPRVNQPPIRGTITFTWKDKSYTFDVNDENSINAALNEYRKDILNVVTEEIINPDREKFYKQGFKEALKQVNDILNNPDYTPAEKLYNLGRHQGFEEAIQSIDKADFDSILKKI